MGELVGWVSSQGNPLLAQKKSPTELAGLFLIAKRYLESVSNFQADRDSGVVGEVGSRNGRF